MVKKSILKVLVISMIAVFIFSTVAFAADTKSSEAIKGTPSIDGDMEALWDNAKVIEVNNPMPEHSIENAATAKVRTMWDEDYVYIFAKVYDSTPNKNPDQQPWHVDGFEIFVDEGNEKAEGADSNDAQYRVDIDNVRSGGQNWDDVMVDSAVKRTDYGYDVEIAIPLAAGGAEGQTIGIDFQVNDDVGKSQREGLVSWNAVTPDAFANFSVLGNLSFVGSSEGTSGAVPEKTGDSVGYSEEEAKLIKAAFIAAYQDALDSGFNPGEIAGVAKDWDGVICQNFKNGDSNGSPWGIPNFTMIAMKDANSKAYLVKNEFIVGLEPAGATRITGSPLGNDDGQKQQFENGALVLEDGAAKWVPAEEMDATATEESNPDTGDFGTIGYVLIAGLGVGAAGFTVRTLRKKK